MKVIFVIIQTVLSIAAVVSFLWSIIGIPVGIIGTIFYLLSKDKQKKAQLLVWIKRGFLSIAALIIIGVLWAILMLIANSAGVQLGVAR